MRRRDSDSGQNTRASHLREDQTWSERHGTRRQTLATCFTTPTSCLRNRCFRPRHRTPAASSADLKVGTNVRCFLQQQEKSFSRISPALLFKIRPSLRERIGPQLELHHLARRPLAGLHVERRARADGRPETLALPAASRDRRCGRPSTSCRTRSDTARASTTQLPSFSASSASAALPVLIGVLAPRPDVSN